MDNFPKKIIIHHSAGTDKDYLNWQEIRNEHLMKGWIDIGYHFGVDRINEREEVLLGRSPLLHGSHCPGMNSKSIGICLIGNFSKAYPSAGKLQRAAELVAYLVKTYQLSVEDIEPHSKYRATECPGLLFDMEKFKRLVGDILNG